MPHASWSTTREICGPSLAEQAARGATLARALKLHDALAADNEPPSAWAVGPWTRNGVSQCPRHGTTFDTSSEPCWQCKDEADNEEAARKPAANERQRLPITRWATTEPRADAIAGSEVLIDGHRHTIEGDCCARTACLDCAGTDSRGSHLIRHQQPVMGGTASICERCPDDAHRWKAREASNEARQPPSAVHPASVYPAALELLAQRARQWAAAERLADERAAALETATETLAKPDTHDWLDNVHRYACAQAGARVAGKVADDTLDWLKEAAMALLTEGA